ncbi:hypothetical protein [Aliiroseovarius sp.]|uniref:hypothetical protein n=1 Tax=Aliiroseovarius sp. TaxID=1872442 RepID=UPI003BAAF43E
MVGLESKFATRRGLTVLLVTYAVVFGTILLTLGQLSNVSGGYGILDFEQGYSPDRVNEILGSYGPEGMSLYNRIQILDVFNPALYSLVAAALTYLLWRGRGPAWVCLMPLMGGFGDYAENVTLFLIARAFPDVPEGLVQVSSALSLIKNGLLVIGMSPLVIGIVLWTLRRIRGTSE